VLPLRYLFWIGLGSLAVAVLSHAEHALRRGPYRYVRDGRPLVARVLTLAKAPSTIHNGQASTHAFTADIVFRDPDTGTMSTARVKSRDFASARKDVYDTPFRRGDYATAVYLPGQLPKSLRLYAFLDLSPTVNIRRRRSLEPASPWKAALLVLMVGAIFAVLFANVYAFGRYQPIDFAYQRAALPMAAGAVVLGGGVLAFLYLSQRHEQQKLLARARHDLAAGAAVELPGPFLGRGLQGWVLKLALIAGAPLLGAGTAMCWCFMANAWLDRSESRLVPAHVEGMKMTTHAFLFREYELEYRLAGSATKAKLLSTPQELSRFQDRQAIAYVRDGWLGWPWVAAVVPPR
jgi:hypothetical protein